LERSTIGPLDSCAGFAECGRGRLLYEIVQNDSGSGRDRDDYKARDNERLHVVSPVSFMTIRLSVDKSSPANANLPESTHSRRERLRLKVDENPPQRAYASVQISRPGVFQIDEKAPDPGGEMVFEKLAIGVGWSRNISSDKTCHDLAEKHDVILGL
jgi:hypothetical protein